MSQPFAWKRYLRSCEALGYEPDPSVETILLNRYKTLYQQYCHDNDIENNPSTDLDDKVPEEKIAQLLFLDLCEELGYESIIDIRRNLSDLKHHIYHKLKPEKPEFIYDLGSRAEGLRISTSDNDQMVVCARSIIVNDTSEILYLNPGAGKVILIMENTKVKPGYVRLQVKDGRSGEKRFTNSYSTYEGTTYLSSSKYREFILPTLGKHVVIHGPCTTIRHGHRESDTAYCLSCTVLPIACIDWNQRCEKFSWPSKDLIEECIAQGCQLAPVGSKNSSCEDLEWRISFILMEKKLLFSLNHCQFLCYGMLKIYLNEILNKYEGMKDLVSSYIMKTSLFWEVQSSYTNPWYFDTLLQSFGRCVKRIYKWIQTENCPNFFIPQNNMFENRVYGCKKQQLQTLLETLLGEKFYGLYRCQSIDLPYLVFQVLINDLQGIHVSLKEEDYISKEDIEIHTWHEINAQLNSFLFQQSFREDLQNLLNVLQSVKEKETFSLLKYTAVKAWISEVIVYINSHKFKELKNTELGTAKSCDIFKTCSDVFLIHDHPGSVSLLYLATMMYITGQYKSCLEVIIKSNKRLKEGYLQVIFFSTILQIQELRLELETTFMKESLGIDGTYLYIDPSLYASMLSVLCHYRLRDTVGTDIEFQLLQEIRSDMPFLKVLSFQEISWQIVGICAEIIGYYDEAYSCYLKAYKSPRFFLTDRSIVIRIICLIQKLVK